MSGTHECDSRTPWTARLYALRVKLFAAIALATAVASGVSFAPGLAASNAPDEVLEKKHFTGFDRQILTNLERSFLHGRRTFRHDTFGDEAFWGDTLKLHQAVQGERFGGVGGGLTPKAALALGLKVDLRALPGSLQSDLRQGRVNLDDPAVTLTLLRLDAVVGVKGFFAGDRLRSIGITCAICHSTVDNALAPGIGNRLDGWAARDLDIGSIVALAPDLSAFSTLLGVSQDDVRKVLRGWGPGKFDAELVLDGKTTNPNTGRSSATLIPPAFGLAGVNLHTWTGWGSVTHWNAFVANLEMHGKGTFFDPRLDDAAKFPIAAANKFGHVRNTPDLITPKLPDLHFYQLAIPAPTPPAGSFDAAAATRGQTVFNGKAQCATCHVPPLFTEPGWNMHTAAEVGIDDFQAKRSPDERYRTSPLKGLWTHQKGGFYHDGRFATLAEVIEHYNSVKGLSLTAQEKADLAQYLLSL
jgi:mono/diheme cytochrome c family protein